MLAVIITKESIVAKYRRLGVVERKEQPEWAADQPFKPFTKREYGHAYKTIVRGSKKRS